MVGEVDGETVDGVVGDIDCDSGVGAETVGVDVVGDIDGEEEVGDTDSDVN